MISKEKIKEILENLSDDLYSTEEDMRDSIINYLYEMQISEEIIAHVGNLLFNLKDDTFDLFESAFEEIEESK